MKPLRASSIIIGGSALVFIALRFAIAHEVIPWSVSDADGHGPDYGGAEWRGALLGQARLYAFVAAVSFFVVAAGAYVTSEVKSWWPAGLSVVVLLLGYILFGFWRSGYL